MSAPGIERHSPRHSWDAQDFAAFFHERAAIREYDGGLSRADAERLALIDTSTQWLALNPLTPDGLATTCRQCCKPIGPHALAVLAPPGHVWLCDEHCHAALLNARKADALTAVRAMLGGAKSLGIELTGTGVGPFCATPRNCDGGA